MLLFVFCDARKMGKNKTVGNNERTFFAFFHEFFFQYFHFPRQEVDKNNICVFQIRMPKIFPIGIHLIAVWREERADVRRENQKWIDFESLGDCSLACCQKKQLPIAGPKIIDCHSFFDPGKPNHRYGYGICGWHKRRAGQKRKTEVKEKNSKAEL